MDFLQIAQSRYTTKKYDPNKKVDEATIENLKEIIRLSPSSINSQPWKFTFVSDEKVKSELAEFSYNNKQKVLNASHVVVFGVIKDAEAFENEKLLGAAFGSFAEEEDGEDAMELNGLWVEEAHRGRGISLMLMQTLIRMYRVLEKDQMVAYNHHFAPSNSYYRKLDGEVARQVEQLDGQLLADVFHLPFAPMEKKLREMFEKYRDNFS